LVRLVTEEETEDWELQEILTTRKMPVLAAAVAAVVVPRLAETAEMLQVIQIQQTTVR
jgi:hypothetical protein